MIQPANLAAAQTETLSQAVTRDLVGRGLGVDALGVIANALLSSGAQHPPGTLKRQHDALAQPGRFFDESAERYFLDTLRELKWEVPPHQAPADGAQALDVQGAVARFVNESRPPVRRWREKVAVLVDTPAFDRGRIVRQLSEGEIPFDAVETGLTMGVGASTEELGRHVATLLRRLVTLPFPTSIDEWSLSGAVLRRGTAEANVHRINVDEPVIVIVADPGGDDSYEMSTLAEGSVVIILDGKGSDRYVGGNGIMATVVVVDWQGDDLWTSQGVGLSAAFGGVAVVADLHGNDRYEGTFFDQSAAILGRALLYDVEGDDRYTIEGLGQGYGGPGGSAVLVDNSGHDSYRASGAQDAFDRGGRISKAQGVGFGDRRGLAGGIGVLVDRDGDDTYQAALFAQGVGFFHGMGLLSDVDGNDDYQAVRYAQGAGVHFGLGVLQDRGGDDSYRATVGVSQGMGLDRSLGLLRDWNGHDHYETGSLGQGASTANGIGVLVDGGGRDRLELSAAGWGAWHWSGGLPGFGAAIGFGADDKAVLSGVDVSLRGVPLLGPLSDEDPQVEQPLAIACPAVDVSPGRPQGLALALERAYPLVGEGPDAVAAHLEVRRAVDVDLIEVLTSVGNNELRALGLLGVLHCLLEGAEDSRIALLTNQVAEFLQRRQMTHPWAVGGAVLRARSMAGDNRTVVEGFARQRDCSGMVVATELVRQALLANGSAVKIWQRAIVRRALSSPCWRARAAGLRAIDRVPTLELAAGYQPTFLMDAELRDQSFPKQR